MTKIVLILILFSLPVLAIAQKDKKAVKFLVKSQEKLDNLQNFEFRYRLTTKYSTIIDTGYLNGVVKKQLRSSDKYFGYDYFLTIDTNLTYYYSAGNHYTIVEPTKTIFPKKFLKNSTSSKSLRPESNIQVDLIFPDVLIQKNYFEKILNNRDISLTYKRLGLCNDTIIITIKYFNQNLVNSTDTSIIKTETYYFSRRTKLPLKKESYLVNNYGSFYNELQIISMITNSDSLENFFKTYTLPPLYKLFQPELTVTHNPVVDTSGLEAPEFELVDVNGKKYSSKDFRGKLVVLDFWYTTCAPCIKASNYLETYNKTYSDSGLVIIGMNPVDHPDRIVKFFEKHESSYLNLICTKDLQEKLDANTFPTFIVIDPDWNIIYKKSGFSISIMDELNQIIKKETREMKK